MSYLKDQWPYLTNYLKDGRLEISNNRAERSIKSYVIDRKNFLFANTPSGAAGSAVMFSLIMTALENKLDPWRYLTWLMKNSDTIKDVEELLPWNAPDACKILTILFICRTIYDRYFYMPLGLTLTLILSGVLKNLEDSVSKLCLYALYD